MATATIMFPTDQVVVLSKWGCKWMKFAFDRLVHGSTVHQYAEKLLGELEATTASPVSFLQVEEVNFKKTVSTGGETKTVINNVKKTARIQKGGRSRFAMALAKEAYLKFGARPFTQANTLVTRKWLVKCLEGAEYRDMRTCDKIIAIDRAMFLSFVPTIVHNNMRVAMQDDSIVGMITGKVHQFGKVFSVMGTLPE
jgi:hypothetical protein